MKKFLTVLLSVMLLVSCLTVNAFAADGLAITVEADKTEVAAGDTVNYTVYLVGADKLSNGINNYEFRLVIPEGLTFVENSDNVKMAQEVLGFNMPNFNKNTLKGTSGMGIFGMGYTGAKGAVMTFQCTVDADAAGELKVELIDTKVSTDVDGLPKAVEHAAVGATVALHEHSYTAEWSWAEDYSAASLKLVCACGDNHTVDAVVTSVSTSTCTDAGKVTYTATAEFGGQGYTDVKEVAGTLLPHVHTAPTFVWAEDFSCVAEYGCENCATPFSKAATVTAEMVEGTGSCTEPVTVLYTATVEIDGVPYTATKEGKGDVLPHAYEATWTWAEDYSSVSVVLVCPDCGDTVELSSEAGEIEIDTVYKDGKAYITATVWVDGVAYTNTVVIDWEPAPETADSFSAIYMMSALLAAAGAVLVLKKKVQG